MICFVLFPIFIPYKLNTVDGRNPAPLGMYKTPVNSGINYLSTGAGFLPSTVGTPEGALPW